MSEFLRETFLFLGNFEWIELPCEDFCREYRNPKRTPKEIICSGYFLGCYEPALLVYELAREQNIPVRFLEMINGRSDEDHIFAHCFVELCLNGKWIPIDPTQREILEQYPSDYILFSEGAHRWDSFLEFYEAQKKFVRLGLSGEV